MEYHSDTDKMVEASWSSFQHDGAPVYKLSERSPLLPALSAQDLTEGQIQGWNVCRINRIDAPPVECDVVSTSESILDPTNSLHWNGNIDNLNQGEHNLPKDDEFNIEEDNAIENPESPEQRVISATQNVPRLIWPKHKWKLKAPKRLMTVNAKERWRNEGNKKSGTGCDTMFQYILYVAFPTMSCREIILWEWWAVACEYWLTNRTITGKRTHFAKYRSLNSMSATCARILLILLLPNGRVSISQQGNQ